MRVVITGATGFVGSALTEALLSRGDEVVALSRDAETARAALPGLTAAYRWSPVSEPAPAEAFADADAVVNLVGAPTAGRWSSKQKQMILETRETATRNLVAGMAGQRAPVLVSGSALGYYGDRGDEDLTEQSSPGDDFLADVCVRWEAAALSAAASGARVVLLRTGLVLGKSGGAMAQIAPLARLGLSGPLASGRQWWPWVHLDDVVGLILHAIEHTEVTGPLNVGASHPVRQREFARTLGRVLRRPAVLPAPASALRLVLGGFAREILSSRRMLPAAALASGYTFAYSGLEAALRNLYPRNHAE